MSKVMIAVLAVSILVPSFSWASRARLEALGQSSHGSYFIKDYRNIFLNPASVVKFDNQINLEMGNSDNNTTNDTVNSPKAEGGVLHRSDYGVWALQLGRLGTVAQNIHQAETDLGGANALATPIDFLNPQNSVELVFGKSLESMDIGIGLLYANSEVDSGNPNNLPDSKASAMTVRAGMNMNAFGVFAEYSPTEESKTTELGNTLLEYKGASSLRVGGLYNFHENMKVSLEYLSYGHDFAVSSSGVAGKRDRQDIHVNFFNRVSANENLSIFYTLGISQTETSLDFTSAGNVDVTLKQFYIPIVIGAESQVKEWLSLRASVRQNTFISQAELTAAQNIDTSHSTNSTVAAAGLSLVFGDVMLDGTFETATSGKINGDEFLARAALKYNF